MGDCIPLVEKKRPYIGSFVRTASCLGDPQGNLLACLQTRDLTSFADILEINDEEKTGGKLPVDHWINQPIEDENGFNLLMLAVKLDYFEFVDLLLKIGADATFKNPERGFATPLHTASEYKSLKSMEILLAHPHSRASLNSVSKIGRTALHICVEKDFRAGIELLLRQPDIEVNVKDKKGSQTPLYMAVKAGQVEAAKALIANGGDLDHKCFGKTIKEHLESKMPELNPDEIPRLREPQSSGSSDPVEEMEKLIELMSLVRDKSDSRRLEYSSRFRALVSNADRSIMDQGRFKALLLKACFEELPEFVEILLASGGLDPNAIPSGNRLPPILAAAKRGDYETMKILFRAGADMTLADSETGDTVLHCIMSQQTQEKSEKLDRCLRFLLDPENEKMSKAMKKIINKRGSQRNTALHHAARLWPACTVRALLELGANIGMKNKWDEVPIGSIPPETMEEFFNDFCMQYNDKVDVNHEKFELTFDYSFLAPPNEDLPFANRQHTSKVDAEEGLVGVDDDSKVDSKYPLPETDSLWYLSQSRAHRHLLKHPVITSFLWLKWIKIRRFFNRNLRFYLLFVVCLTWFIFENFGGENIRPSGLDYIPVCYGLYVVIGILMLLSLLRDWKLDVYDKVRALNIHADQASEDGLDGEEEVGFSAKLVAEIVLGNWMEVLLAVFMGVLVVVGVPFLWTALLVLAGVLALREALQMAVSLKRYLLEVENWIELATIGLTFTILFYKPDDVTKDNQDDLRRHLAAIALVLSWIELITLVGKHPKLTSYNIYVVMFYQVTTTFFFFLFWFAFIIVAFGLGFYIMLHKDIEADPSPSANDTEIGVFDKPWLALVKTSAMFIGELEFGDFPIDKESSLSPVSYLYFLAFVFLIVVVLMNLLNGLAVSDIGVIQAKAEIVSYTSQVKTISYSESLLLGDPFNFLSNWPAFKWLKNIHPCSLWTPLYRNRYVQMVFNRIFGAQDILLFYSFLPNKRLTCKIDDSRNVCTQVELMDETILLSAKSIIMNKIAGKKSDLDHGTIESLHDQIRILEGKLDQQAKDFDQKLDLILQKLMK